MTEKPEFYTKARYVYEMLKDDILSGKYQPREKIVIRNVAESVKFSDIPVREAIRMLEAEGLVVFVPHVGATVAEISYEEMHEAVLIREILEPYAGKLAARNLSNTDLKMLELLIEQMDRCIELDDYKLYGRFNKEFHDLIYKSCGNSTLYEIIKNMMSKTERTRAIFRMEPERMRASNLEHKQLLVALKERDTTEVESLIYHQRIQSTLRYMENLKLTEENMKQSSWTTAKDKKA